MSGSLPDDDSGSPKKSADASVDAGPDAPADATVDASADAAVDESADATVDASGDTTVDTSADATPDARIDATLDASLDSTADALVQDVAPDSDDATAWADGPANEDASPGSDAGSTDAPVEAAACVYPPAPASSAAVLQYHKNPSRDGVYVDPAFTPAAVAGVQLRLSAPLTGQVYAQPLYVPNGPGGREVFIAATEANHVTAIDACGVRVWDRTFGSPAAYADLPCGNIYPTLGITGTPVIDDTARVVYFDAMTQTGTGPAALRHMIHAISLDDGSERPGWPVDVQGAVPGFVSSNQNQRGGLTLLGGILYVPYGGHYGDCGQYYGWIVGVPVSAPASVTVWRTIAGNPWDSGAPISGAGFWAPGGLPTDGTSLFAFSGNANYPPDAGSATPAWVGSNTVFRLGAGPTFSGHSSDYFHPADWLSDDYSDQDLSGGVLFGMGGSRYLVTFEKYGVLHVVDPANLDAGAVLTYPFSTVGICQGDCNVVGTPLAYTTTHGTYVSASEAPWKTEFFLLSGNPLQVVEVNPAVGYPVQFTTAFAAPIATTTDGSSNFIVWTSTKLDPNAYTSPGVLYAQDGITGTPLASTPAPDFAHYFDPPIAANGRIVVAACGTCYGPPGGEFPPPPPTDGQLMFFY